MAEKYTLDELVKMGAKPVEVDEKLSLEAVRAQGGAEVPEVGPGETFLNRAVNALPLGRLVTDALGATVLQALRPRPSAELTEEAKAELAATGEASAEPESPGLVDTYRDVRDTRRVRTEAGSEQNPNAARAGTGAGLLLSVAAPLPKTSVGAARGANGALQLSRAARIGNAALTGGLYGGLSGATDGEADTTRGDVAGTLRDASEGAAWGGLIGGGLAAAAEGVRPLAGAIKRFAVKQAKKTIQGGSDIAAATRKPLSDEAAQEALESGAIRPLSTTQATAERIEDLATERGAVYGRILDELETLGVQGPNAKTLADGIYQRYLEEYPNYVSSKTIPEIFKRVAKNVEDAALPGPRAPAPRTSAKKAAVTSEPGSVSVEGPARPNLGLRQTERIKQDLQEVAKYERLNANPSNETYRELASTVRQANEDAIEAAAAAAPEGSRIRELGDAFKPAKAQLARTLEARHFARPGASKAEQRSSVGLKDYLLGASTGNPFSAAGTALLSSVARNRLPSTLAYGAYGLSEGLRTGGLAGDVAAGLAGGAELAVDEAQDRANRATIDERTDAVTAALIRALRTRPNKNDKKESR